MFAATRGGRIDDGVRFMSQRTLSARRNASGIETLPGSAHLLAGSWYHRRLRLVLVGAIALGCSGNGAHIRRCRTDHQFDASNASMRAPKRMIPRRRRWMTHSYAAALTLLRVCVILGVTGWTHDCTTWQTRSIVIISCGTLSRCPQYFTAIS